MLEGPYAGYELAVTRALGHKNMEPLGVLDDPHVVMLDMDPAEHCCLVRAGKGGGEGEGPGGALLPGESGQGG